MFLALQHSLGYVFPLNPPSPDIAQSVFMLAINFQKS